MTKTLKLATGDESDPLETVSTEFPEQWPRLLDRNRRAHAARREKVAQEPVDAGSVIARLDGPEFAKLLTELPREQVRTDALNDLVKVARGRVERLKSDILQLVREVLDVDPGGDWSVDFDRALVVQSQPDPLAPQVIEAARVLAGLEEDTLRRVQAGHVPAEWKPLVEARPGIEGFFADLAEFVLDNEGKGAAFVKAVCSDAALARRTAREEDLPRPVQFLATLVVRTRKS